MTCTKTCCRRNATDDGDIEFDTAGLGWRFTLVGQTPGDTVPVAFIAANISGKVRICTSCNNHSVAPRAPERQ